MLYLLTYLLTNLLNHSKARDEFLMLQLLNHVLSEDLAATSDPTDVLAGVGPATKLLSAYTRRG